MSKSSKVTVNDLHHFNLSLKDVEHLDAVQTKHNHFHIIQDHISYDAEMTRSDFLNKSYAVKINNTEFFVQISNDLDVLIEDMGFHVGSSKTIDLIKAPMPGLILDITIKVGDHIKINDPLLVLEAMKMENSIVSPREGIIKSIAVTEGITVDKGDVLIEFE
ncbi:acetyl-CoA carboxylase biotin carboxyl carrier protein subunit [Formosa algae]|uniref:Biotin carboxyl carrier protein n=1 Tax=Formosa algae TaxID=225843 RepID=A0A9X0YM33_9FLAO|nr:acetyl-CoA carboxylase biotin carboxyl carrier protein subunit [Formosa algae]MBP1841091.1 biotin carboxyl carrier protein [Formosa algae]MDQ0336489.1 biotin carboxyl carrier protein [Formosa algae]OEI81449.1 acetyl-CoA carboxylase biotin carboxyl carrier protein subunit [Formosa algae]PNW26595.1 acetyl-CoA carboxylase biotin carboxyl carrier protein subunit [Formosa algae]